jgi:hypothetical protein
LYTDICILLGLATRGSIHVSVFPGINPRCADF